MTVKSYNYRPPKSYNYSPHRPPPKKKPRKKKPVDIRFGELFRPGDPTMVAIRTEQLWGAASGLVVARLLDTSPQILAGGGWEDVPRPLRRGLAQWRGTQTPTMPLSIIFDGLADDRSVEGDCETLMHMAGGLTPDDPEPPQLILYGAMLPRAARSSSRRWVIQDVPAWDTSPAGVIRKSNGVRVRQAVDLTLMLVADDDLLHAVRAPAAPPRFRRIKARQGDTFEKIAKRELGSKRFAHKLAALNGKGGGSVSRPIAKGTSIKIPTATLLAQWRRELGKK